MASAETDVPSDLFSEVCTGIGKSIDNLELNGDGTWRDATSGLTGWSVMPKPNERAECGTDMGLMGDSVYSGGRVFDILERPGSDLASDTVVGMLKFVVDSPG